MSIINIKNLTYRDLFSDLNLQINNPEFISLSGANNCGKTTLLRILSGEINNIKDISIYDKDINEYRIDELGKIIQIVIPQEIKIYEKKLYEEISYYINGNSKLLDTIIKGLRIKKLLDKNPNTFTSQEVVLAQLALAIAAQPRILLIDNISPYFNNKEIEYILLFLKEYFNSNEITIIYSTINLEESLIANRLVIINDRKIELDDEPIELLQKDNIINKIGLNIPFMIDLSVKLKDYDLLDEIELDKNRMVDKLWN